MQLAEAREMDSLRAGAQQAVLGHLMHHSRGRIRLLQVDRQPLGPSGSRVERLEVHYTAEGGRQRECFVLKRTQQQEVEALELLQQLPSDGSLPELLGRGVQGLNHWALLRFVPGQEPSRADRGTIEALARVHVKFEAMSWHRSTLPQLGTNTLLGAVERGWEVVTRQPFAERSRAASLLRRVEHSKGLRRALERHPRTLLHGNLQPSHLIKPNESSPTTICGWGHACVGPAILDVLGASDNPALWRCYWEHAQALRGREPRFSTRHAHALGEVLHGVLSLPFALEDDNTTASRKLIDCTTQALSQLERYELSHAVLRQSDGVESRLPAAS